MLRVMDGSAPARREAEAPAIGGGEGHAVAPTGRHEGPTPTAGDGASLAAIERAMMRIRRSQTRRTLGRLATRDLGQNVDLAQLDVVLAVDEGPARPGEELTVGLVAERLGIDPSRASRMVAGAIRAGWLRRVASQADGRRIHLELTEAGREIAQAAHRSRQALYDRLMRDWSERDRGELARLLTKFTEALGGAGNR
jgi:DNA-binding MarR family transcriptional regulator